MSPDQDPREAWRTWRRFLGGRVRHFWVPTGLDDWWLVSPCGHKTSNQFLYSDEPDRPLCRECERRQRLALTPQWRAKVVLVYNIGTEDASCG